MRTGRKLSGALSAIAAWLMLASPLWAWMFVAPIAPQSLGPLAHWKGIPAGTEALLRDSLRGRGWHRFFSELPNDVVCYGFEPTSTAEVQHLVDQFAAIDSDEKQIFISPGSGEAGKFEPRRSDEKPFSVVFRIGNEPILREWYERLPKDQVGISEAEQRTFGQWKLKGPPQALPPTLVLYLDDPTLELTKLTFPDDVTLHGSISDEERRDPALKERIRAIETLISRIKRTATDTR